MGRITVILFLIGLILEFAAFLGGQTANIPIVLKLVSPECARAQFGIQLLVNKKILQPEDPGFSAVSKILIQALQPGYSSNNGGKISVEKLTCGGPGIGFGPQRAGEVLLGSVVLSNGQTIPYDFMSLRRRVDTLQNISLFAYSLVVFLVGVMTQCFGFFVEHQKNKRAGKASKFHIEQTDTTGSGYSS